MTLTSICKFHVVSKFKMRNWPSGIWWEIDELGQFFLNNKGKISLAAVKVLHVTSNEWEIIQ